MLTVSSNFSNAEKADVNQIAGKVYLVLGDYASASAYGSTATASSTDGSGSFPASGSIDGDRTELNVGAASTADNDIGLSSWKSATAPSVTPQTLTINFGVSRTINRIKLYHLSAHGLKSYKLESSPDNVTYTLISKTTDQGGTITTTNQLDTVDFSDTACQYVKLTIADTVVAADKANVVAIECYRKVDVSDYVTGVKIDRSRDYKIANPLASTFTVMVDNNNRFFSFNHTATSSETASGFVNSELGPGIGVIVQYGFAYGGKAPELVTVFVGNIDRISVDPANRTATLEGRDNMKSLINQVISSKLKTSVDIQAAIKYALNLCNISNYEMSLDATGITIDYFFINNQSVITTIQQLVQAVGDAQFYFDENGLAVFKDYVGSTPQSHIDTSEADFEAGTVFTNIDTVSVPGQIGRKWFLIDDFADNNFNLNPVWTNRSATLSHTDTGQADFQSGTVLTNIDTTSTINQIQRKWFLIDDFADNANGNPTWQFFVLGTPYGGTQTDWSFQSNALHVRPSFGGHKSTAAIQSSFPPLSGTWQTDVKINVGATNDFLTEIFFASFEPGVTGYSLGIRVYISGGNVFTEYTINKYSSGARTILVSANNPGNDVGSGYNTFRITRTPSGTMKAYKNGSLITVSVTDNTLSQSQGSFGFSATPSTTYETADFTNMYYASSVEASEAYTSSQAVFESAVIDQTAAIVTEGLFNVTDTTPAFDGSLYLSSILFYTATSSDSISWDAYVAVTPGGLINSVPRRYIKWKAILVCPIDSAHNAIVTTPTIQDVTITWGVGGWQCASNKLKFAPLTSNGTVGIDIPFSQSVGTWRANVTMTVGSASGETFRLYFLSGGYNVPNQTYVNGYYAELNQTAGEIRLYKIDSSATRTLLGTAVQAINGSAHSLRVTRTNTNIINVYWDEVSKINVINSSFVSNNALSFEVFPNSDQNGNTTIDDIYFSPQVDGTGAISSTQSIFESQVVDMTASVVALGIFQTSTTLPTGTSIQFYTATSTDGTTFEAYQTVSNGLAIPSTLHRYIKWKAVFTCPIDDGNHNAVLTTPYVNDVTLNWSTGSGSQKFPTSVSYTFRYSDLLLGISQEIADNLGGDSSIINDVSVQAKPLILTGDGTATQWQGTVQTPPVAISVSNPLSVTNGQTLTYALLISSGMDITNMSGANPSAAVVTFSGGGAGSWVFSSIHPTRPILKITITGTGNITDLRVIGKAFSNNNTIAVQTSSDASSIKLYGDRQISISNVYIVNSGIASNVASKLVANYKSPISYIPTAVVRPTFSLQLNDRTTIVDDNTGINADYIVAGVTHEVQSDIASAQAQTSLLLLKVT